MCTKMRYIDLIYGLTCRVFLKERERIIISFMEKNIFKWQRWDFASEDTPTGKSTKFLDDDHSGPNDAGEILKRHPSSAPRISRDLNIFYRRSQTIIVIRLSIIVRYFNFRPSAERRTYIDFAIIWHKCFSMFYVTHVF